MTLLLRETFVNETKGYRFGEDGNWYEAYTEDRGKLFRSLQHEYGRCISRMYLESKDAPDKVVGWVFSKKMLYEDARRDDNGRYSDKDYYVREVWVELRDTPLCLRCGKDETNHHEFVRDELNHE